jgi:RNA-directed DNA polymerase
VAPPGNQAANGEDKGRPKCLWDGNPYREVRLNRQKSAEGIVGGIGPTEGPNVSFRTGTFVSRAKERQDSMAEMPEPNPGGSGRNPQETGVGASSAAAGKEKPSPESGKLMEEVVESKNLRKSYRRVVGNKGAAGVDGMTVEELGTYLKAEWQRIREQLVEDRYRPQPVRRVEIPKPGGKGVRKLGIPTVVDRLIQQALLQVLEPTFDPGFSESSYGFRPGRSAHQAVLKAREYVAGGKRWVVDLDIEKFFDRVNHDVLMARVARKVKDKRVLRLIRQYLQAGIMDGGLVEPSREGTPQGGPLSPLLSNVLLDELDKELEGRGHAFCRYADDCNIYVASRRAGERVMESVREFLEKRLRLKLNNEKSAVDRPWRRKFLGYSMTADKAPRLKVAPESEKRLRANLRVIFKRGRGRSVRQVIEDMKRLLVGWSNYFKLAEVKNVFEKLDEWIRRRMRCILWRQWKRTYTRARNLMKRGLPKDRALKSAMNGRGPWWNAGAQHMNHAFPKSFFDRQGLASLLDRHLGFVRSS